MNNKSIKKLVYKILREEIKEHNVEVDVLPLTSLENIAEIISTNLKIKPRNLDELISTLESIKNELYINKKIDAYYNYMSNKLKIIIKNKNKVNETCFIWKLIKNIYHEYRHALVEKLLKKPYIETKEDLIFAIENLIEPTDEYYLTYHDDLYEEILANNYGIKKAEHYLKTNMQYKEIYEKLKTTIELDKLLHEIYYRNYDFQLILEKVNKDIKQNINEINLYPDDKELEIVRTLYNKNGKFKSLKELSNTDNWNILSKEAKYLIISSEAYLNDFDYNNASKEELYLILDALSYALTIEYERPKYNQEYRLEIESISRTLTDEDLGVLNLYVDTLLILNTKEESNKIKIEKLQTMINTIINILKQKESTYQNKKILAKKHKLVYNKFTI